MKKILKQIWIVLQMICIILPVFFALFIPAMYLNVTFYNIIVINDETVIVSIIVFFITTFGLLFMSIAIAGKFLCFYDDLYKWEEQLKTITL